MAAANCRLRRLAIAVREDNQNIQDSNSLEGKKNRTLYAIKNGRLKGIRVVADLLTERLPPSRCN
ncbi:hypothetical protein [Nostoc sp. UHCC 0252]|uniref:hypothetical protein n=1 Tax=Nostoc sp. UHCC 0252 TaxID=3110241 RepID=UPI002B21B060|nr:hypothetical protein [Nostoc sp. UHCC 0252]MEA5603040.1 hypothetical protein [Nostoc sp. UHCC 0252]